METPGYIVYTLQPISFPIPDTFSVLAAGRKPNPEISGLQWGSATHRTNRIRTQVFWFLDRHSLISSRLSSSPGPPAASVLPSGVGAGGWALAGPQENRVEMMTG